MKKPIVLNRGTPQGCSLVRDNDLERPIPAVEAIPITYGHLEDNLDGERKLKFLMEELIKALKVKKDSLDQLPLCSHGSLAAQGDSTERCDHPVDGVAKSDPNVERPGGAREPETQPVTPCSLSEASFDGENPDTPLATPANSDIDTTEMGGDIDTTRTVTTTEPQESAISASGAEDMCLCQRIDALLNCIKSGRAFEEADRVPADPDEDPVASAIRSSVAKGGSRLSGKAGIVVACACEVLKISWPYKVLIIEAVVFSCTTFDMIKTCRAGGCKKGKSADDLKARFLHGVPLDLSVLLFLCLVLRILSELLYSLFVIGCEVFG